MKPVKVFVNPQKRFLDDFAGVLLVAHHANGNGESTPLVSLDKLLESLQISSLGFFNKNTVFLRLTFTVRSVGRASLPSIHRNGARGHGIDAFWPIFCPELPQNLGRTPVFQRFARRLSVLLRSSTVVARGNGVERRWAGGGCRHGFVIRIKSTCAG